LVAYGTSKRIAERRLCRDGKWLIIAERSLFRDQKRLSIGEQSLFRDAKPPQIGEQSLFRDGFPRHNASARFATALSPRGRLLFSDVKPLPSGNFSCAASRTMLAKR
jgi:hypothetical protein